MAPQGNHLSHIEALNHEQKTHGCSKDNSTEMDRKGEEREEAEDTKRNATYGHSELVVANR